MEAPRITHPNLNDTVSICQDENNAPFEGPEKLLELWWSDSQSAVPQPKGLRAVKRNDWESMLDLVHCKVLSVIQGNGVDAYMLSESSMFVWPHKLILKTCGTTTLLEGLSTILSLAESVGFNNGVWRAFYSRKSFMFPAAQRGPHRSWNDEMRVLDAHFVGSGYTVGPMNGDHWLLYISNPRDQVLKSMPKQLAIRNRQLPPADHSIELLMSDLHPDACKSFYFPEHSSADRMDGYKAGKILSDQLGITTLFNSGQKNEAAAKLDSYLFQPCGYSANLVIQEDRYATIHVTPECESSYASFETNFVFDPAFQAGGAHHVAFKELVAKVLGIFRPGRWCLTLFLSKDEDDTTETADEKAMHRLLKGSSFKEYRRTEKIVYDFEDYDLLFSCFVRQ